jgi:CDK-activating kinase assembly factor MAT1
MVSVEEDGNKRMGEQSTIDDICPVCKSDRYLNPAMELLVSPCYHRVCSSCVERLYGHGSAPCPVCGTALRRAHFTVPLYEDLLVERECRIRKRLSTIFNKREEDFETSKDYNDYLEEVEGIVWNLVQEVDVQATSDKLEAYRQQNLEQIMKNKELAEREATETQRRLVEEERQRMDYDNIIFAELEEEEIQRRDEERRFIEELAGRKTVGRESKRRAKEAAIQQMPSMRGLRIHGTKGIESPQIDPLETVPEMILALLVPITPTYEDWFYGSRIPDTKQLAAGGISPFALTKQVLLASCIY